MTIEHIAIICHEANKALCETQGDFTQMQFNMSPQWQIDSAINGVKFHLENPDAGPDDSHKSWLKEKEEQGWQYGPVKNAELKVHPCFVPYEELPSSQQAKDYLFRGIVHALAKFIE